MTNFSDLGLAAPLLQALAAENYTIPTPIQAQAIPQIMAGRDLLGTAQTGTGKTAAFALPILHRLLADKRPAPRLGCRVLVLSPTRELASQIAESFRTYGKGLGLHVLAVFGGVGHKPQVKALERGLDIMVATPGRLIDHVDARACNLSQTEYLVLDEVDQMLDLGFLKPIKRIVAMLPKTRQNLFFSATMPREIGLLAAELLTDPVRVSVAPVSTTAERVSQRVIMAEPSQKKQILVELLREPGMTRTIVFTRTKHGADKVCQHLETHGITGAAIHGNKSQGQRERALAAFRDGEVRALIATDIAARGIDIDSVSHVINFELPEVPEAYVHRIGRTARAGSEGSAISLCSTEERDLLKAIEKVTKQSLPSDDRRTPEAMHASMLAEQAAPPPRQRQGQRPHGRPPQGQQQRQGQQPARNQGQNRGQQRAKQGR